MKIVTFLGTRPEIIRLRCVIDVLDAHSEHVLVHPGQNFEGRLRDVFFRELDLRSPGHHLGVTAAEENREDDVRFPARYWDPWHVEER